MDPFITGALVSGGANLLGGLFSQASARGAYQHRYQDTVADMRKAGLNPALAYSQNPGAGAQTHNFGDIGEAAMRGASTASAAFQAKEQTRLIGAQADLLTAQAKDILRRTKSEADTAEHGTTTAREKAREQTAIAAMAELLSKRQHETYTSDVKADLARNLTDEHQEELAKLGLNPARVASEFSRTFIGRNKPTIDAINEWLNTLIRGAAAARGGGLTIYQTPESPYAPRQRR